MMRATDTLRRSRRGRAVDVAVGRVWRLPPPTSDYSVTRGHRVPMRDGVDLVVDHYAPSGTAKGTLLARGPYGRGPDMSLFFARPFAARGYHVVLGSTRGTFGSGGVFPAMVRDTEDGEDVVAWLRGQPWFTGRFATFGASYLGFSQWSLLADPPPELAAAIVAFAPHDPGRAMCGTGAFALDTFLGWCDAVAHQEEGGLVRSLVRAASKARRLAPGLDGLPLAEAGERVLTGRAPWYRDWLAHHDLDDPFWESHQADAALDRVRVPVLLFGGWQDVFLDQTFEQYTRLHRRDVDVALIVGPWTHLQAPPRAGGLLARETLEWLNEHLAGTGPANSPRPVRVFVTGAEEWRDLPEWPPPTVEHVLYLQPGGGLGEDPPAPDAPPSNLTYDPADPTPTVGGRLLSPSLAGYRETTALERRTDVLTFSGPALDADVEILGAPAVELEHSSDNPYADVFVRLCEVDARGRSRNLSEAFRRLARDRPESPLRLELDAMAHRFRAGSRIRLEVSGGSHPRFGRNLGTGEDPATGRGLASSHRKVAHGAGGTSRMILPCRAAAADDTASRGATLRTRRGAAARRRGR